MKKILLTMAMFALMLPTFTSCGDDDETEAASELISKKSTLVGGWASPNNGTTSTSYATSEYKFNMYFGSNGRGYQQVYQKIWATTGTKVDNLITPKETNEINKFSYTYDGTVLTYTFDEGKTYTQRIEFPNTSTLRIYDSKGGYVDFTKTSMSANP